MAKETKGRKMRIRPPGYSIWSKVRSTVSIWNCAAWAEHQRGIWDAHETSDQLDQIIWRLKMNLTVDNRAALGVAEGIRRKLDGRKE